MTMFKDSDVRRWLLGGVLGAALAGCGAPEPGVAPEERQEVAQQLRLGSSLEKILLELARWYREIYTPPIDFNGDGYADFAAGTSAYPTEQVNVFYGGPGGYPAAPSVVLPSPDPARYLAFQTSAHAGDVNGDGYSDLAVGANGAPGGGAVYLYFGGPSGLPTAPSQALLASDTGIAALAFGLHVASAKDIDLDGYDDLMVSAIATRTQSTQDGAVFVYRGGPAGLESVPSTTLLGSGGFLDNFGASMAATYLNFDPYPDLIVGEVRDPLYGGSSTGRVHVFLGGPGPLDPTADAVLLGPSGPGQAFGLQVANVGDVNLDGLGDFAVSEPLTDGATGRAYVYFGTPSGVDPVPGLQLEPPAGNAGGYFSWGLGGGGDINRDGLADLAVGETDAQNLSGEAHLYFGPFLVSPGAPGNPVVLTPDQTLTGTHAGDGFFGQSVAFVGDADDDLVDELLVGAPAADAGSGRVYSFEGTSPGNVPAAPEQTLLSPVPGGGMGLSISN